ncbi:DotU/TssL family secretion system protein [Corallococcus sp. BB11-1]|uniref:DotU family type IV/VI secretion system protein n=1 Tax=Corallococcus sp. BB11-1 TaxID=2996783 RepID=UPI00226D7C86|nr:DotU/TssL family secretion system protein [Corallococcus sp. BB11-1]MCY1033890.1 DotU/TssL family secretion system protein [Corallococcus sp. BB11-1]
MQALLLHHRASLLEGARQFLAEVLRLQGEVGVAPRAGNLGKEAPTQGAMEINRALRERLNLQALRRTRRAGEEDPQAEKVRYALAAFADEVFLHHVWPGQKDWRQGLLERDLFHTGNAGDQLFEDIQELLERQGSAQAELAAVYLLVLSLGFEGRYRDTGRKLELEEWHVRLAAFVSSRVEGGLDVDRPGRQLFAGAYASSVDMVDGPRPELRRLSSLRPWFLLLLAGLVAYVVAGQVVWFHETHSLRDALERIERATR